MNTDVSYVTLDEAAAMCAAVGLADLDRAYWIRQTDRGRMPCAVVGRKKRIRRDYIDRMLDEALKAVTAPAPVSARWARQAGGRAA